MIDLEKFLEPIELAGTPLQDHHAYRMDYKQSRPDMRLEVGLGTCNCCDYFMLSQDDTIILIEETRLIDQHKDLQNEYHYLESTDQKQFIDRYIRQENQLKAYGSALVLCRLSAVCQDARNLLGTKKYKFWLVVSGMNETQDAIFFNNLKIDLLSNLRSVLSRQIVDEVEILPSDEFVGKLSEQTITS